MKRNSYPDESFHVISQHAEYVHKLLHVLLVFRIHPAHAESSCAAHSTQMLLAERRCKRRTQHANAKRTRALQSDKGRKEPTYKPPRPLPPVCFSSPCRASNTARRSFWPLRSAPSTGVRSSGRVARAALVRAPVRGLTSPDSREKLLSTTGLCGVLRVLHVASCAMAVEG